MFSATIRSYLRGHRVHLVVLAELMFDGGTMYLHNEGGLLPSRGADGALEGMEWRGMEGRAAVSNLGPSKIGMARSVTCSLDALDTTLKAYFADHAAVRGRKFRFWGQFYDVDLTPLDPRFHLYTGIGDRLRMTKKGPGVRRIDLVLETRMARRRMSAASMVTHSDQQARDPGNTGFIFVQKMVDQTLNLFDAGD